MSYGRHPYHIFDDGKLVHFIGDIESFDRAPIVAPSIVVPREMIAQFVASMAWRGQEEIDEWIALGKRVRPDIDNYDLIYKKRDDGGQ